MQVRQFAEFRVRKASPRIAHARQCRVEPSTRRPVTATIGEKWVSGKEWWQGLGGGRLVVGWLVGGWLVGWWLVGRCLARRRFGRRQSGGSNRTKLASASAESAKGRGIRVTSHNTEDQAFRFDEKDARIASFRTLASPQTQVCAIGVAAGAQVAAAGAHAIAAGAHVAAAAVNAIAAEAHVVRHRIQLMQRPHQQCQRRL
jgi:hypothetical protein